MFTSIPPLCATDGSVKMTLDVSLHLRGGGGVVKFLRSASGVAWAHKTREPAGRSTTGAAKERRERLLNCKKWVCCSFYYLQNNKNLLNDPFCMSVTGLFILLISSLITFGWNKKLVPLFCFSSDGQPSEVVDGVCSSPHLSAGVLEQLGRRVPPQTGESWEQRVTGGLGQIPGCCQALRQPHHQAEVSTN